MKTRMKWPLLLLAVGTLGLASTQSLQERFPGSAYSDAAFTFHRIHDDVYHAVPTGTIAALSNAAIVINSMDVLIVDSHVSPAAATALLTELRRITEKPVRYVVNSHFHLDHAHGNQAYPPSVEIIGHEFTHNMLATGASNTGRSRQLILGNLPQQITTLRARLDTTSNPEQRAAVQRQLGIQESFKGATDALRPVPPTVTLDRRLTLYRGGREIQIEFLGRGHTGGDVVVYLPAERILMTGDLLLSRVPYLGDAYIPDWIETLERLKRLEFDVVLPGHGPAFTGKETVEQLQAYFRDLWSQIVALHRAGVPAGEAQYRIDMRAHTAFPNSQAAAVHPDAILGAYEVLNRVR
jgi:cyclase